MDNLNTHNVASLYNRFPAGEARRLAERLQIHYTPKHGSWLDIAEIELSALARHGLNRRIETMEAMRKDIRAWTSDRDNKQTKVNWQFTCADARVKLRRLYPSI